MAVGMFGMPLLGKTMALAHYIGALVVGLTFRFYGGRDRSMRPETQRTGNIIGRAVDALVKARTEDGRPLGQMMGDAVNDSIRTLWLICGFIMLFSTMVKVIDVVHLYPVIAWPFEVAFRALHVDPSLVRAAVTGLFEIDLGTQAASKAVGAGIVQQAAIAGAIIAWSGLSVHGQVASVLTGTDIRMAPYMLARFLHALVAFVATLFLMKAASPALLELGRFVPVLGGLPHGFAQAGFWEQFARGLTWAVGIPLGLTLVGFAAAAVSGGMKAVRR